MKPLGVFCVALLLLSSCSVSKNVNRKKEKTESDSVASTATKTALQEKQEKTTVTTTMADTVITIAGSTVRGSAAAEDLDTRPFILDDHNQTVTVSRDAQGNLNVTGVVKDRKTPIRINKRIEEKVMSDRKIDSETKSKVSESKMGRSEKKNKGGNPYRMELVVAPRHYCSSDNLSGASKALC